MDVASISSNPVVPSIASHIDHISSQFPRKTTLDDDTFISSGDSYADYITSTANTQHAMAADMSDMSSLSTKSTISDHRMDPSSFLRRSPLASSVVSQALSFESLGELFSHSRILLDLQKTIENSDPASCWDDMAGVLLWIALTAGTASNKSGDKDLQRYFSALVIRVSMFLCFDHPEALHATVLRMAEINEALAKRSNDSQPVKADYSVPGKKRKL